MSILRVENLGVSFGQTPIFQDVSFELNEGDWLMMIGPNGSGKSTLVGELARNIGILAQNHYVGYAFTVREVVRLGRYDYRRNRGGDPEGESQIRRALELTGMNALADKSVLHLSGGELQRVFLAQLFAQAPRVLILDEPTNHLDLIYQKQVFELVSEWRREPGRAVISVVHDLSLARAYGTQALLLYEKRALAQGSMERVFDPAYLNTAYGMDVAAWMRTMLSQWS